MALVFGGDLSLDNKFDGQMGNVLAPSADKHFAYEQATASDTWTIHHNLNKFPSVSIVDTANTQVVGEVEYIDTNTVRITFNAPFGGYAYLN